MFLNKSHSLLVGAGVLVGTLGLKALTSDQAKRIYAKGLAQGMLFKKQATDVFEQAKAEFDDVVAQAEYLNAQNEEEDAPAAPKTKRAPKTSAAHA